MSSSDECELTLPEDTLLILNEFLHEKSLKSQIEQECIINKNGTTSMFEEDWQLSQFWYSDQTKSDIGKVVKEVINQNERIALLSCPSLYSTVKAIHNEVKIFEFDKRFSVFGDDYIFYDFNEAISGLEHIDDLAGTFDLIIADPPFLSEECIKKTSRIINLLKKPSSKILFCSGKVVEPWVKEFLNLDICNFQPQHEKNLANIFVSYANFEFDVLLQKCRE